MAVSCYAAALVNHWKTNEMESFDHNLCPFCSPEKDRIIINGLHALAITDGFPVSDGHALIIPRRHIQTVFDATAIEQTALMDSLTRP